MKTNRFEQILRIIICVLFFYTFSVKAQNYECNTRGYDVFNVEYATQVPILHPNTGNFVPPMPNNGLPTVTVKPKMTIYRPKLKSGESTTTKFPIAIVCHGSYKYEGNIRSRNRQKETSMCIDFANRGILAVTIDYRLDQEVILESHPLFPFLQNVALWMHLGTSGSSPCDKIEATKRWERIAYSNAMDIHNAVTFLTNNQSLYRADINSIMVGGHSLGGLTSLVYTYVEKSEIASSFNSNFFTDNRFIDISSYRNKLKLTFASGAGITNLNFIDDNEKTPLFLVHGTHDGASPFYTGTQMCSKIYEAPDLYGSAAIAEKLDAFPDNLGFSYYFVQLNGIGHNTFFESDNFTNNFVNSFFRPDLYRYMLNVLFSPIATFPKNQIYKIVSPNNNVYNYCNLFIDCGIQSCWKQLPVSYFHVNKAAQNPNDLNVCGTPMTACLSIPNLNLTTKPWVDNYANSCTSLYPAINFNTYTNDTCIKNIGDTLQITVPDELLQLYYLIYGNNSPQSITSILNGNYSFLRQKSKDKSINPLLLKDEFSVYPNPSTTYLNIDLPSEELIEDVSIYNTTGTLVFQQNKNNFINMSNIKIEINNLTNGTYIIRVKSNDNIYSKKFVVNH